MSNDLDSQLSNKAICRVLTTLFIKIKSYVGRVLAAHAAARAPTTQYDDELSQILNESIDRLANSSSSPFKELLHEFETSLLIPNTLSVNSLQLWLQDPTVRQGIKDLVKQKFFPDMIMGKSSADSLAESFHRHTGEGIDKGYEAVNTVTAIVFANCRSKVGPNNRIVVGLLQANNKALAEKLNSLGDGVERSHIDNQLVVDHSNDCKAALTKLLKGRSYSPSGACEKIDLLVKRVSKNGDLCRCSKDIRAQVFYWAARLYSLKNENLHLAKDFRTKLLKEIPEADTKIIDALILETEGSTDSAFQILREVDDPDVHAVLFSTLLRVQGEAKALAWFDNHQDSDNPDFFSGLGWYHLAAFLAKSGRWEDAIKYLTLPQEKFHEWPDLWFIKGITNAAMLLPVDLRHRALDMNLFSPEITTVQGEEADKYRNEATVCFSRAETELALVDLQARATAAHDWILWLQLTSNQLDVVQQVREEVQEGMKDGCRAVDLLPLAKVFNILFDETPIKRYLYKQEQISELGERELVTKLMLAETTMDASAFARFIEHEEKQLLRAVPQATLTGLRVDALLTDGEIAKARNLMHERNEDLAAIDRERLHAKIMSKEGEKDLRTQLEKIYRETGEPIDLQNYVDYLYQTRDWTAVRPLLEKLFKRERTVKNAIMLVHSIRNVSNLNKVTIQTFLETNWDLLEQNHDLSSEVAKACLQAGDTEQAKALNDKLLNSRDVQSDTYLDIDIALQGGDWERFPAIIDHVWSRRNEFKPDILLQLASIAAGGDSTGGRAFELTELAVSKAPEDPIILTNAYALAVQLGREDKSTAEWLARAVELSSDSGPIWQVDPQKIVEEMAPAYNERTRKAERGLMQGSIPIHVAAAMLNIPLSQAMIGIPDSNLEELDGRRRVVVPIISGGRQLIDIKRGWTVGLDITSIMVLNYLGLLGLALKAFQKVIIASDTMVHLLNEQRRVRFHQPSRIEKAEEVRSLIDRGFLKIIKLSVMPPEWLVDEVGLELASLLETARHEDGFVVRPLPLYKLGSFLGEDAEIGEYSKYLLPTRTFSRLLYKKRLITKKDFESADQYLKVHDNDPEVKTSEELSLECALFLDDLAVTYLQESKLLPASCQSGLNIFVSPSLEKEQISLSSASRKGNRLATELDKIRNILKKSLINGRLALLPWTEIGDANSAKGKFYELPTLYQFLQNVGQCNAICVDDRCMNSRAVLTDQSGCSVPILCVLDVINFLEQQSLLTSEAKLEALHELRTAGFALIPTDENELHSRLDEMQLDVNNQLIESKELRILRQSFMRIRSLGVVNNSAEFSFLAGLRLAAVNVIRRIWKDKGKSVEHATALSEWIWRNIAPSPFDWSEKVLDAERRKEVMNLFVQHISFLLSSIPDVPASRRQNFQSWAEREIIEPLLPANSQLVDEIAHVLGESIKRVSEDIADETR